MFVYGDLKTVYVDFVLWRSFLDCMYWVRIVFFSWFYVLRGIWCAAFCLTLSAIDIPSQRVFRVLVLVQCSEPPSETKNTAAWTASLEWMHSIVWALIKVVVQCLEPSSETKNTAALAASLEWMHSIVWALIGGCVGIATTSILSSGAGTMGLRHSVGCVQSCVPGLLPASHILSKRGA